MPLVIYNSRTRRKEEFSPLVPGRVSMYVCGVTVYDDPHIGHARCYVAFDAIHRHFLSKGWQVNYVRNFTDVDDKIIARARERGEPWDQLARRFEHSFSQDMAALGVLPPTVEPRATEHIAEIIATVQTLVEKGHAYQAQGDVYFAVNSFDGYGALSGRNLDEMRAGARVEVDRRKRHPLDFALWKASKPGEPAWDSPWGPGRPGWHIECSVMSQKYLGAQFDIHGGGRDLIFPHHENEVAQAEAAGGSGFARYWVHNGFVQVNQEKMSKSLGNFYTIKDILKEVDAEALRLFLLSAHYRSPLDFSDQALSDAASGLARLYTALRDACQAIGPKPAEAAMSRPEDKQGLAEIEQAVETFEQAMDDDFNTAGALGALFALARIANRLFAREPSPGRDALLGLATARLLILGGRLGLLARDPVAFLQGSHQADQETAAEEIEALIAQRAEARQKKDFARADAIRKQLSQMGVVLEDTAEGTRWRREY